MVLLVPRAWSALSIALGCAVSCTSVGAPRGHEVVQGNATVTTDGATTTITNTPGAIINWQQFSVAPDEITRFVQQDAASAVLNRVTGSQRSEILGQLLSNGRVFLINPNGIAIGAGARINTAGFVASSLGLSDADFLVGRQRFEGSGAEGAVVNQGSIDVARGGAVYLVAPNVENHGVIAAPNGEILLAAGHSAELVAAASPNLRVRITAPSEGVAINVGQLVAEAGRIGLFGASVRGGGLIDAGSAIVNARGEIVLSAVGDAYVDAGGQLDATNSAGRGGDVILLGDRVAVLESATVDASGATGGGSIRVGGDYLGANADLVNASATVVAPTASLRADAAERGDGGRIIVWSNHYTGFLGAASVRGGAESGDGGFVETSSRGNLQALGAVDAAAQAGRGGEWLLDPYNITIRVAASSNGSFSGGDPNLFTPIGNSAVASRDQIVASLNAGTSVTVSTGGVGSPGAQAGTISVLAPITKSAGSAATLTLDAASNITFSGSGITSTGGSLNLTLISAGGAITGLPSTNLNGGTLTLDSAAASTQASGAVISGNTSLVKEGSSAFTLAGNNTYTGSTTINDGALRLGAANRIPNASSVVVGALGTLNLNGYAETIGSLSGNGTVTLGAATLSVGSGNASSLFDGVISGTGRLTKIGTGTLTLGGANTYTGLTTVSAGTLALGAANRIANASALSVAAAGTFSLGGFDETVASLTGAGAVSLGAGTLTAGGNNTNTTYSGVMNGSGGLIKTGTGTMTLSGVNTYTGATSINAGRLSISGSNRIGDESAVTVAAGATFNLGSGSETIGSLAGAGSVTAAGGTLSVGQDNTNTTFGGVMSGTGRLTKIGTGTLTLSGANTYTGATNIAAGTLRLGAAERVSNSSALTVQAGATFDLNSFAETVASIAGDGNLELGAAPAGGITSAGNASTTFAGVLSGAGNLTKRGTGTLTLAGANSYTGNTNVSVGTLVAQNDFALGATAGGTLVASGATLRVSDAAIGAEPLTLTGNGVSGAGALTGDGVASFAGPITLAGATRVATTAATSSLTLQGTIDGSFALNLAGTGTVALNGPVGGLVPLASLSSGTAPLVLGGGSIRTTGQQSYSSPVVLAADTSLTSTGSGAVTLSNLTGAGFDLTVNSTGTTSLSGLTGIDALTTDSPGTVSLSGNVEAATISVGEAAPTVCGTLGSGSGAVSFAGAVTLCGDTTVSGTTVQFGSTVDSDATARSLVVNASGATDFVGSVGATGALASLRTDASGTTRFHGGNAASGLVQTVGAQTFDDAVDLVAAAPGQTRGFRSNTGAAITFASSIDSAGAAARLVVDTSGVTTFAGAVGAASALDSLATDSGGSVRVAGPMVRTLNGQSFDDAAVVTDDITFITTNAGQDIRFAQTLDGDGSARSVTMDASGATIFGGSVGGVAELGALTTLGAGPIRVLGGGVTTSGAQSYGSIVLLGDAVGAVFQSTGGGDIGFLAGVDSGNVAVLQSMTVTTAGLITMGGDVGGANGLSTLTLSGSSLLSGGSIRTRDTQLYDGDVLLGADTTLTATGAAPSATSDIVFNGTIDSSDGVPRALTVNSGQLTRFAGAIGGNQALASLTTDAPGHVELDGGLVRTQGAQTYNDPVTLGAPTSLVTGSNGDLVAARAFDATAGLLTLDLGAGSATLADAANDFDTVAVASAGDVNLVDANALLLGGVNLSGTLHVSAGGDLTQSAPIVAATLLARTRNDAGAAITLSDAANDVDQLSLAARDAADGADAIGAISYADRDDLTVLGLRTAGVASLSATDSIRVDGDVAAGSLTLRSNAADIELSAGRTIATLDPGASLVLDAALRFVNEGATLDPGPGRWVIYSQDPALDVFGGLASGQTPIWGFTSASLAPDAVAAGNRYVFAMERTLIFSSVDAVKTYGDDASAAIASSWIVTGLNSDTFGGAFLPDDASAAFTGTPLVTSAGSVVTAGVGASPYMIDIAAGSLSAAPGFVMAFDASGRLTVVPRAITVVADGQSKDFGEPDPALTYVAHGLVNGDSLAGGLVREPGETLSGSPYRITQGSLTDAANQNYLIAFTDGYLTILPGRAVPSDRALQLALIRAVQTPVAPACLPSPADSMPGLFAAAQERLDRASARRLDAGDSICETTQLR